jgi:hypothetical protein
MWKSKDIAIVIIIAAVSFAYTVFVGQLGNLLTGIQGLNYLFIVGHAIFISFGFLMYEGRRWRLLLQGTLAALLTLTTALSGAPFDVVSKIPMILTSFFGDLIFNSFYAFFKKRNRLDWLAIFVALGYVLMLPFFVALNMSIFYTPQALTLYISVYMLLLPVTIVETVVGGYIGNMIYKRVSKEKVVVSNSLNSPNP